MAQGGVAAKNRLSAGAACPILRRAGPRRRLQLAEIIKFKEARRRQQRAAAGKRRLSPAALPGWAYFLGLVLLAAIVAALRSL
jgi:hypothetical protein